MTQLPLLVKELIGWYIWNAKIKECNKEYHKTLKQFGNNSWTVFYNDTTNIYSHILLSRNLSRPDNLDDYFIYNFTFIVSLRVANLPQRYFYSSGINNGRGFFHEFEKDKRYKKVNSWLFQL
jgi:hypothetical protein